MAENQEDRSRDDLTEEASPYRIEEFRRKGQVAQSRELTGLVALLAAGVATYALTPKMGAEISDFMRDVFRTDLSARLDLGGAHVMEGIFFRALHIMGMVGLPICLAGFVFGIAASLGQVGSIFSFDPLTPKIEKINPIDGLKKMFSVRQAVEGLKLISKMIVVIAVAYGLVKSEVLRSPALIGVDPEGTIGTYGQVAWSIFMALVAVLAVFSGIDYFMQKREFEKNLRMTKQEAKQEHREREGDPQIKARIRAVQREMSRRRMMAAVRKADVVITNPTHIAIAIVYEKNSMMAPRVVAKGADLIAQRIKEIAKEANIPMVENVPLARTLFKTVKLNQYVPRALYQAVAEVLAYVYRFKNRGV